MTPVYPGARDGAMPTGDADPAKALEYEQKAARALAQANQEAERGNKVRAEELYALADHWMRLMNKALGNG